MAARDSADAVSISAVTTAPLEDAEPAFDGVADDIRLDREHDHDADDHRLEERVDVEQVHPVPDDPDHQRADDRVADVPSAAEEARPADDDRRDGVELRERSNVGAPAFVRPR